MSDIYEVTSFDDPFGIHSNKEPEHSDYEDGYAGYDDYDGYDPYDDYDCQCHYGYDDEDYAAGKWDALTDGQYGDYPGGDIDYDILGFGG